MERDLGGVECLSGIPGLVGGTPVQNVGAYGQETADVLVGVRALDRQTESVVELVERGLRICLPHQHLQYDAEGSLHRARRSPMPFGRDAAPHVKYPDLLRRFEGKATPPTLAEVRELCVRFARARAC